MTQTNLTEFPSQVNIKQDRANKAQLSPNLGSDFNNYTKGDIGEHLARMVLSVTGYNEINFNHKSKDKGIDISCNYNGKYIAGEVHNWYGGYCHPERWDSTMANLVYSNAETKVYFAFGVSPTEDQCREAVELGVTILHLPYQITEDNFDTALEQLKQQFTEKVVLPVITISNTAKVSPFKSVSSSEIDSKPDTALTDTAKQTELHTCTSIAEGSSITNNTMRLVNSTSRVDIGFKGKAVHNRVIETIWQKLYGDKMAPFTVECYVLSAEHFLEAIEIFGIDNNIDYFTFCKSNHSSEYVILVRESNFDDELNALKSEIEIITQTNWLTKSVGRLRLYE